MHSDKYDITIFLIITSIVILLLASLIITLIYLYQKKQFSYKEKIESLKIAHEKILLGAKLEIQEDTFQHISREIHDNISLSLTLAKLNLNTFDWTNKEKGTQQLSASIEMLSQAIIHLSDISKSLNSDIIISQGLIKAIESEIIRIQQTGIFSLHYNTTGCPVYMDTHRELIIFRIIQEVFNNIIKHANASSTILTLHYTSNTLYINISDNGNGFIIEDCAIYQKNGKAGLKNIQGRMQMIGGTMNMKSIVNIGTSFTFIIPI